MAFAITPDIEFNAKDTANVTINAGVLESWTDKIGGVEAVTIPSGATGPATTDLSLDGTPVPHFVSGNYLKGASGYNRSSEGIIITQLLIRRENNNNFFGYLFDGANSDNRETAYYAATQNPTVETLVQRVGITDIEYSISGNSQSYTGEWVVLTFLYDQNGIEKIFINDQKVQEQDLNSFSISTGLTFGARSDGFTSTDHYMAHLIEYKQNLTDQQIADSANEMLTQWGLLAAPKASGSVTFNDVAFSNGVVDFFSAPSPTGTLTLVDQDVAITNGVATMTTERDPLKDYFGVARGMTQDFSGTLSSGPVGNVISTGLNLTGVNIGGVNDDHYIFRATGGTGAGTEVTVTGRTGGDITVTDASAFATGTEFTLGRFVRGISRVFPKD